MTPRDTLLLLAALAPAWLFVGCGKATRAGAGQADALVRLVDVPEVERLEPASADGRVEPDDEFPRPGVARVELDAMHCEALLLDAPGELAFRVELPAREPHLRLRAGQLGAEASAATADAAIAVLAITASAWGEPALHAEREVAERAAWQLLDVDLTALAGREVELRLRALPAAGREGGPVRLALGDPVVEGLPVEAGPLPPDVVLVSLDTVRSDRLSLYGAEVPTSPELDAIGAESAVFDTAVAPSSWTLPSHVSVFSGQLPARHHVDRRGRRFDPRREPDGLAGTFRAAGYETIAYTAGGYVHPDFGLAVGFERYGTRELVVVDRSHGSSHRLASTADRRELLATLAGERRRPLFVFVHTYGAHGYQASVEDLRAIGVDDRAIAELAQDEFLAPTVSPETYAAWDGDPEPLRTMYDASLVGVDALAGDLVGALRRGGYWDRSYFVVFSDHGEELAEHGVFGHAGKLVEELIRVPLLLHGPGILPGRIEEAVSLCDVAPTLKELVGLPRRRACDGRSLVPYLSGAPVPRPDVLSSVRLSPESRLVALRGERLKLLAVLAGDTVLHAELFDVVRDPEERRDLAAERPEDLRRMLDAMEERLGEIASEGDGEAFEESPLRAAELAELGYAAD